MQATTQYFVKRFFINRSFTALPKFYARDLGVKITAPYCIVHTVSSTGNTGMYIVHYIEVPAVGKNISSLIKNKMIRKNCSPRKTS
jgi:hypothetical protein